MSTQSHIHTNKPAFVYFHKNMTTGDSPSRTQTYLLNYIQNTQSYRHYPNKPALVSLLLPDQACGQRRDLDEYLGVLPRHLRAALHLVGDQRHLGGADCHAGVCHATGGWIMMMMMMMLI